MSHQPMQPLYKDDHGTIRFRENKIVQYLKDNGGIDMNHLAVQGFPQEDREQFAQLIGYSLSGFSELGYVRNDTYDAACKMSEDGLTEEEARIRSLEETLKEIRKHARELACSAFGIHPDDLHD